MTRPNKRIARLTVTAGLIAALLSGCSSKNPETMIASAKEFLGKKDNKSAIIQLKNALQKAPDNAEARFLLGQAQLDTKEIQGAEKELRRAMDLNYAPDSVIPLLARALLEMGEFKKIADELGSKPLTSPDAKAAFASTLGRAQLAMQKPEEAQKQFDAALALKPGHAGATLGIARLKAVQNDLAAAGNMVDQVLAKEPALDEALFLKADLLLGEKKSEEATKLYDKILASDPENLRAHTARFMISFRDEKLDLANTQLEAMKKAVPQHPQTRFLEAMYLMKKNEPEKARTAIQEALKTAPNHPPILILAGEIELRLNSPTVAANHLAKALDKLPNNPFARRLLTAALIRSGQGTKALETMKPLLESMPDDPGVHMLAGEVFLGNNNLPEAEKHFAKAVSLDSKSSAARTRLGQVKFAEGDAQAGLKELEAASNMDGSDAQADILLVVAHLRRNEADKALAALVKVDKKMQNNPVPHNLRASALLLKNDPAGARKSLEQALAISPTYFPAALTLARLDAQDKNWDGAQKRFLSIIEKDPKNAQALLALAQTRAESGGKPAEIQDPLEKAVAGNPTNPAARVALVRFLINSKALDKAISAAQDGLAAIPNNYDLTDWLGIAQLAAGQTNQAVASFNKLISMRQDSPVPLMRMAGAYVREKQFEMAEQQLRKALVMRPDLIEAQSALVAIYVQLNKQREAVAVAREVQKQKPKEPTGYLLEADIAGSQKKWGEAISVLRQGLNANKNPALVIALNKAFKADNQNAEADKVFAEWLRDNPKDTGVRTYMAESSLAAKQLDQAFRQYKEILVLQPKNPLILNNLAWIAGQLKDAKAVEYAEQANSVSPNTPAILDTLGMLLVEKGDDKRGLPLVQQALALAPDAAPIRLNLAKAYAKAGQKDAAKKEIEVLMKLDEKHPVRLEAVSLQKTL